MKFSFFSRPSDGPEPIKLRGSEPEDALVALDCFCDYIRRLPEGKQPPLDLPSAAVVAEHVKAKALMGEDLKVLAGVY